MVKSSYHHSNLATLDQLLQVKVKGKAPVKAPDLSKVVRSIR